MARTRRPRQHAAMFPDLPSTHAILVMALTVLALVLFTRERIALESSSLFILFALALGFALFPYQSGNGETLNGLAFFQGFGHPALIAISGLMVASYGLIRTGALDPATRALARLWTVHPRLSFVLTLSFTAVVSAFVSNTPQIIVMLPLLVSVARRANTPASHILMPVGFMTVIGGMTTTIGTSTNLLIAGVAADMGVRPFGMFDFFVPALFAGGIGFAFLFFFSARLLPAHQPDAPPASARSFSALLTVTDESFANGKTVGQVVEKTGGAMHVARVQRNGETLMMPLPDVVLQPGDRLRLTDTPEQLQEFEQVLGMKFDADRSADAVEIEATDEDLQSNELVIVHGSAYAGMSLNELGFSQRHNVVAIAVHRAGKAMDLAPTPIGDVVLRAGDILLVKGTPEALANLRRSDEFLVLDATADLPHTRKAPLAIGIMSAAVALAAFDILPIAISALGGVLAMLATGVLSWRSVGRALSVPVILMIVVSLALGTALVKTGAAEYLAKLFVWAAQGAPPAAILGGLMLLMSIFTNLVANSAAGVIGTPIAVHMAQQLGWPPEPFVLAVLFGANMGFIIPTETNLLVLNAGRYRFADFIRVGTPLTLLMWAALAWFLPRWYGLG